jgi:transglutaminase-like putative cysteine protease
MGRLRELTRVTRFGQARLAVAGVIATCLTALSLIPLLDGWAWVAPTLVVVLVVAGTGAAVRAVTRLWPLVALAQVAALAVVVTALFARGSAILSVVPTPASTARLGDLLQAAVQVSRQNAAPVPTVTGVILIIALGVGLVGLLVDLTAVSLRQPAVAGLPLLATYCVPAAILPGGMTWWLFVLAALGFLLLVSADAGDQVQTWGRMLRGSGTPTWWRRGTLAGGRRVALGALALAVAVPIVVPGLDDQPLTGGRGAGKGSGTDHITVVNPILTLRDRLGSRSKAAVIAYRTTVAKPEPIRIVSDDVFTGAQWAPTTGKVPSGQNVRDGLPFPPGLANTVATRTARTDFHVGALPETYLPLPYPTTLVNIEGDWLYEAESLNVVGNGGTSENQVYSAHHLVVEPTAAELEDAGAPPSAVRERYTALPGALPKEVATIAAKQAGPGNAYQKAVALQDYLRTSGGFSYSEQPSGVGPESTDSGQDAVLAFLHGKQGYCVQFASAFAVMARTLGIPSRVAVGFLPGTKQSDGSYLVTLRDAHAWPELYFEGVGWARFEPTPVSRVPEAPGYSVSAQVAPTAPSAASSAKPSAQPSAAPSRAARDPLSVDDPAAAAAAPWWQRVPLWVPAALAVALLVGAVPMLLSWWWRRRRWARAGRGLAVAEVAWEDLATRLTDLDLPWAWSWTPRAAQHRLLSDHELSEPAAQALHRLASGLESMRYAPPSQAAAPALVTAARQDVDTVAGAVAADLPVRQRWQARLLPHSTLARLAGTARRLDGAATVWFDHAEQQLGESAAKIRIGSGRGPSD